MEQETASMGRDEKALRMEAVQRMMRGESQASIAQALGRSRKWVSTWIGRYDPDDPVGSLADRSSAPHEPCRKWSSEVRDLALASRSLRAAAEQPGYQYALVGAQAIHYELKAVGVVPTPPGRTIHQWLVEAGLVQPLSPKENQDKASKPYPAPACTRVNAVQQLDLKGPLYLSGSAQKHYLLALRDSYSKAVALSSSDNREAKTIANFLVEAWQRLGVPEVLQLDNGLEFRGSNRYPRAFGLVVRLCLDVGVEPLFIPPHEPWRNGLIENLNGAAARLLLNHDRFTDPAQLQAGAARLELAINTTHRLEALDGLTPAEFRQGKPIRLLSPDYARHQQSLPLDKGSIAFIRLVRKSGRITLHAQDKLDIDPGLCWQYVFVRIDVADKLIRVYHDGTLLDTFDV
jgi:transposase InsO family protein